MKPLNLDNKPCSPVSSNCIVWQGPDIPCIKLCTGDSISDVVYAMAIELCTILDTLKVSNYDLTCFNLQACNPEDFQALIQFLIDKICELENIPSVENGTKAGCPDCVVTVAECFRRGTQTTMQLVEYVQLIGERICSIIDEISLINAQIADILIRITSLENQASPTFTQTKFRLNCPIGNLAPNSGSVAIDTVLIEFINNVWCDFSAAMGSTSDLISAVALNCIENSTSQLSKGNPFEQNANWIPSQNYSTVADAINNIWVVLCDIFTFVKTIQTIRVADTTTIDLSLSSNNTITANIVDSGWQDLKGFDFMLNVNSQKPKCRRIGNVIHFKGLAFIPLATSSTSSTVQNLTAITTYESADRCNVGTSGTGAVTISDEELFFNQQQSVIPDNILSNTETIDGSYYGGSFKLAERPLVITSTTKTTRLIGMIRVIVTNAGLLQVASAKSFETGSTSGLSAMQGSFSGRLITSNVRQGEKIPDYLAAKSNLHSFNSPALWLGESAYTVGTLVRHNTKLYKAYANVAASASSSNPAPNITPSVWSEVEYDLKTEVVQPDTPLTCYKFDCDAGNISELGGFFFVLDGLTAFV